MSHFDEAVEVVLRHEGGLVDHPNDPGGMTNFGISERWAKGAGLDVDILNLTRDTAIEIYRKYFWDFYHLDKIENEKVAIKVFDALVNTGHFQTFKCLQRALHSCGKYRVKDDGVFGPITEAALKLVDSENLLCAFRSELAGFYRVLAAQNASKKVFLKGWLKRAYNEGG